MATTERPTSKEIAERLLSLGTKPPRLSASAIDRYRRCPRLFLFQDVARADPGGGSSEVLVVGNAIHEALDRFFGLRVSDRSEQALHDCLRSVWRRHLRPGVFETREQEAEAGKSALRMLSLFAARFALSAEPVAREEWVSTRLPDRRVLFGKVDRIDLLPDGTLEVIDYKTGEPRVTGDDLPDETAALVYLTTVEATYNRDVSRVSFIYLSAGTKVTWEVEREDADAARDRLAKLSADIGQDQHFQPSPGSHCGWCPYRRACPDAGRVELGDLHVPPDLGF